jgi:hypothetical protein
LEEINACKISVAKPTQKTPLGRIILKQLFKKEGVTLWNGFIWLKIGTSGRFL